MNFCVLVDFGIYVFIFPMAIFLCLCVSSRCLANEAKRREEEAKRREEEQARRAAELDAVLKRGWNGVHQSMCHQ